MEQSDLKSILKSNGYSLTRARQAVYNALSGQEPMVMAELIKKCRPTNRASIYRAVDLFESLGIIHKISIGFKYKIELTDLFHEHHHHLHCAVCGVIIPLPNDALLEQRIEILAKNHGFSPSSHQLEITGRCASC